MTDWHRSDLTVGDIRLATYSYGDAAESDRPAIVLVHGWPDTHHLWDNMAPQLAEHYRVFAYDTRGFGESTRPDDVASYRLDALAQDLFAVIDSVTDGGSAHVVAHDWGSVQTWEAVTTPGASTAIASFTSVSGPNLDFLAEWARAQLSSPTPGNIGRALSQVASSAYTGFFQIPGVSDAFFRALGSDKLWTEFLHAIEGTPRENVSFAPTLREDMISGLKLYRANIRGKLARPNPRPTSVPVLEVVNDRDIALRPAIYGRTYTHADKLWRKSSTTGHWLPYTNPAYLAATAIEFIDAIENGTSSAPNTIDRARQLGAPLPLTGKLAVITGAGSGIGRETAYALAALGCEVVLADIDTASADETATECKAKGVLTNVYELDVSKTSAVTEFAETVRARHGVPDIVVNNAGIGLGGSALDATEEQIDRLIDINLRGVISGSRAFAKQMVARGAGGHIVNLASAAAFTPSRELGLYSASKAGVLMFSESLRAELADHRIGVSAICPGIVNTNITAATEYAGVDDQEAMARKVSGFYEKRNYTPDKVAREIVRAVVSNKAVVPVTPEAKFGYRVYRFIPWVSRIAARAKLTG
ncbi:SDR family oxidoreductase [Gordonia humi]|uniref:NAD(P)-dependent dehydrogenase (Short-subunit alcohol dehydrogenase family)/pimeloyl-ACP methyl ester carboxylesterase n=1 Tax=Gordonia humi TaxID=686429 RepID=A0A840EQH1_9ACTN|nr:SDR family oxidoreductase [Gordonia humi]MBB4133751.1 NAD(P)-dependent dehydrogenase (short-subunit alcohol dehydrogenase family)/pimeloyl-ACP methyl ester carboxylesterase [Gordonia humi]